MQFHESNIFQPFCRSWAKVYTALHTFYPAARTGDVPNGLGVACSQQHSTTARLLLKCTPEKLGKTAVERTQVGYVSSQNRLAHRLIAVESLTAISVECRGIYHGKTRETTRGVSCFRWYPAVSHGNKCVPTGIQRYFRGNPWDTSGFHGKQVVTKAARQKSFSMEENEQVRNVTCAVVPARSERC